MTSRSSRTLIALMLFAIAIAFANLSHSQTEVWKVGDKVEAYHNGAFQWYSGAVSEIGAGTNAGSYLVKWEKWSGSTWVAAKNIRAEGAGAKAKATLEQAQATTTPRLAKYLIMSYGAPGRGPLHLGYFQLLAGGRYTSLDMGGNSLGDGRYAYDGTTKQVRWTSGPFLTNKWDGKFDISREGKTHNIRLTRSTLGTNSTDSK